MKKTLLFLSICLFLFGIQTQAQKNTKVGYINADKVLNEMPEVAAIKTKLQQYSQELATEEQKMLLEYQQKVQAFQQSEKQMSALLKKTKVEELTANEQQIKKFQIQVQQEINNKRQELYQPLITKLRNAINEVAQSNGYHHIIDNSQGILLYTTASDDIEALVRKKLGMK